MIFDTSEKKNLARDKHDVRRKGDTLYFNLQDGRKATLVNNNSDGEPRAIYKYFNEISDINCYCIFASGMEDFCYLLINKTTGDSTRVDGKPILSPNKKLIICAGYSDSGMDLNGFELFEINNNKISLIGSAYLENWAPQEARWFDNNTLLVERRIGFQGGSEQIIDYTKIYLK
jgi:hypothetical protein